MLRNELDENTKKRLQQTMAQQTKSAPAPAASAMPDTKPTVQQPYDEGALIQKARQTLLYQQVPQPKWYKGNTPTDSEVKARIYTIGQVDPQKGRELWDAYSGFQQDPSTPFYNPYTRGTNKAIQELSNLGFDMSGGVTRQWLEANSWLKNYYRIENGNTPLAPSSKSSVEQNAAYWYYKLLSAEETTEKAENEWAALQEEIGYWTKRQDRNYSDEEILGKIDWSNYKTLVSMDESKAQGLTVALNRGIGYSQDALRGLIWAARNGTTGDPAIDSVKAALGQGVRWQENREISGKLDPTSEAYSPYSVGSTIDDAALYFGVSDFGRNWLRDNRNLLNSDDLTARRQYQAVYAAEQTTLKAEKELADLKAAIEEGLKFSDNPDFILGGWLDAKEVSIPTLRKMDESMQSGKLIETTRAVDYRWQDIEDEVRRLCEQKKNAPQGEEFVMDLSNSLGGDALKSATDVGVQKSKDQAVKAAAPIIATKGTPEEKIVFQTAYNSNFDNNVLIISDAIRSGKRNPQAELDLCTQRADAFAVEHYFDVLDARAKYEKDAPALQAELQKLEAQRDARMQALDADVSSGRIRHPLYENYQEYSDLLQTIDRMNEGQDVPEELAQRVQSDMFLRKMTTAELYQYYKNTRDSYQQGMESNPVEPGQNVYYEDDEYNRLTRQIAGIQEKLDPLQEGYDNAVKQETMIQHQYETVARLAALNGADPQTAGGLLGIMDYLYAFGADYVPTEYPTYSLYDAAIMSGVSQEEVARAAVKGQEDYRNAIRNIDYALEQAEKYGVNLPDNYRYNLTRAKERFEREAKAADYFLFPLADDYEEVVAESRRKISEEIDQIYRNESLIPVGNVVNGVHLSDSGYGLLDREAAVDWYDLNPDTEMGYFSRDEKERYLYIREKQGEEAARDYYNYMVTMHNARTAEMIQEATADATQKGFWESAGMNVLAAIAAPTELLGTAKSIFDWISGIETDPNDPAFVGTLFRNTVRNTSKEMINEATKDNPLANTLANFGYDLATSAADNAVNMVAFGGLGGSISNELARNAVSAIPMSMEAFGNTVQAARFQGASEDQALAMGAASFFAEWITETITVGNIRGAFTKNTAEEGVKSLAQLAMSTLTGTMPEEAFGEGLSEIVGAGLEKLIYNNIYGLSLEDIGDREWEDIFGDAMYAALLGGVSGGLFDFAGSITTGRARDAINIQYIAKTKGLSGSQYANQLNEQMTVRRTGQPADQTNPAGHDGGAGTGSQVNTTEDMVSKQMAALTASLSADEASRTAAMAGVLAPTENGDMQTTGSASTAAQHLNQRYGSEKAVDLVEETMLTAAENNIDLDHAKVALTVASLGEGQAASALQEMADSDAGITAEGVRNMIDLAAVDMQDAGTVERIQQTINDNQLATRTKELAADGMMRSVVPYQVSLEQAEQKARMAADNLETQNRVMEAAREKTQNLFAQLQEDAGNTNLVSKLDAALGEMERQAKVVKEYQQAQENAQQAVSAAKSALDSAQESVLLDARQQAQQDLSVEREQYEQARQEAAMQQQAALAARQDSDNVATMDAEDFTDRILRENGYEVTDEERQKVQEIFKRIHNEMGSESVQHRDQFVNQVGKKFGIRIEFADTTQGGKVSRQNGYYDRRNNRIVLDSTATIGDAMYFVAGHELTHVAEQSGTYDALATSLLKIQYGIDVENFQDFLRKVESGEIKNQAAAEILAKKLYYDQRLSSMHEQDSSIDATPLTVTEAAQEVVADIMGNILKGDQGLIDQLVAEEPSTARRILDSIKAFLKKLVGIEGEWKSDTQRVVDMLETALKDAQGESTRGTRYSLLPDLQLTDADFQKNRRDVVAMAPVKTIVGNEFVMDTGTLKKDVLDFYQTAYGGKVEVPGIGTVSLDNKGLSNSFGHGMTPVKAAAYAAVPDVLKNGKIIQYDKSWKGQQRDTIAIAAPIEIGEGENKKNYLMGVVVNRPHFSYAQRYYTHDAVGLAIKEIGQPSSLPVDAQAKGGGMDNGYPTIQSLLQELIDVNSNISFENDIDEVSAQPIVKDAEGDALAVELPGGTITRDVSNSLSSWTEEERSTVRQNLIERGFAEEDVNNWINNTNGIAATIAADKTRLDFEADETKSMVKPNADYGASIDASTLCAKRLVYQGTFDAIQHLLPNTALMPEDLIDLANMMREMGYETPCGICYVESRRRNLGKEASKWLEGYNGEYKPTLDQVTTSDGLEQLQKDHPQAYKDFMKAMADLNQRNPKVVQLRTDYRGEIQDMTARQVQKAVNHGGLRLQSFSDFETPHLLDMVQVVMDMASKGLTSQAYTKVPNFAWVFGDTGIKINLSLIGAGDGVDANGNLIFDNTEGMNFEEAMRIRDRYSKNVGTILVGMNDAHIFAAMADDRIDYIIPFHRSGWTNEELAKMPVLESYTDYQNDQNEKRIIGKKKNGKGYETMAAAKSRLQNFEPVGENGYWDFSKSGKENAETYLRLCAEDGRVPKFSQFLVDNGDGSFSLQPDGSTDGYWKTLIDFKMYDNDGVGSPQMAVTPEINMEEAQRVLGEYSLNRDGLSRQDNNALPVAQPVVDRFVEEYKAAHPRTRYSLPIDDQQYIRRVQQGEKNEAGLEYDLAESNGEETQYGSRTKFSLRVTDQNELDFLNNQDTITTYKTMQLVDGKLYPPMAAVVAGNMEDYSVLGEWEKATEHPELIKNGNKFTLNKGRGKGSLDAAYNPYMHSSNLMINDQFSGAYNRPELVTVECQVPVSEMDSGYHAEYAKDSVGWHNWHTGTVAGQLRQQTGTERKVFLSRWIKPVRIIPDSEVAQHYASLLRGTDIQVPDNVVSPSLLNELQKTGVPIRESGRIQRETSYSLPSDSTLEAMIRNYIAQGGMLSNNTTPPAGNNLGPARQNGPQRQRQFGSRTAQQSQALHDEVKQYLFDNSDYTPDTNRAQIDRAIDWVQRQGSEADGDGYFSAVEEVLSPDFDYMSADGQARMLTVMSMAALKGDVATEMRMADAYNQQGTEIGRALQARQIFRLMTPLGRKNALRQVVSRINQRYIDQGKSTRVQLSEETLERAGNARTAEEFAQVQKQAYKELAEQMPSNWKERLRTIRYFSMLFNPVTHIRNMLGNAAFVPAVKLKNIIGTAIEGVFSSKLDRAGEMRTKSLTANRENRRFAQNDAVAMKDVLTGEAKFNQADPVERERKMFGKTIFGKIFQGLSDFNSMALEAEDWAFLRRHYANALAGWMQANNVTAEQLQGDQRLLDQARAYAVEEAQKATYRDASKFSSMMSDISRKGGVAGFIVDAALPFKKTPTNILKRGIEYSPIGLLKTLVGDSWKLKLYNQWAANGREGAMPKKAITPTQYIDRIASGLSGTAISALGVLMSAMGWLKVGLDDEDEIAKQNGEQQYALKVHLFGQDVSYTIDWMAPSSMPLFVGASLYNEAMKSHDNENALDVAADLTDSLLRITEPVFNLSMLDGVNSLLQTSNWGDAGNNITDVGATLLSNYVTSFVPTVVGKVAKTVDTTRRETFVESGTSKTKALLERTWQKTLAKVPGASSLLKPYVSPLGEEEHTGTVQAVLQNFFSPGYFKTVDISDMEQEMQRLYEATQEKSVIPKQPAKYFTVNGEKITMDAAEYTQLQKARGTAAKDLLTQLVESPEYQIYGDDARVKMIDDAWTYSTELAKAQIDPDFTKTKWVAAAEKSGDPLGALIERREAAAKAEYIDEHKRMLLQAIEDDDSESLSTSVAALLQAGKGMADIRTVVTNYYKPIYQQAMEDGDIEAAQDIKLSLILLNLGYKESSFKTWDK